MLGYIQNANYLLKEEPCPLQNFHHPITNTLLRIHLLEISYYF